MRRQFPPFAIAIYLGIIAGVAAHGIVHPEEYRRVPVIPSPRVPDSGVVEPEDKHSEPDLYSPTDLVQVKLERDHADWMHRDEAR